MSVIKPINRQSVHQICSGQVILDLATAVKELLENALDAEASSIEIKLKDHGKSSIEVSDNGQGIEEVNYDGLTKKHHTSKLQDFSDLTSVTTFGFRGEALSSLCALSDMIVTTRFKTSNAGHRLEYDHDGKLLKKACIARQPGTSVILRNLFMPLPVRHVEFEKNIKREFSKLTNLLYSYCIICTGVKISCSNEAKGVKRELFQTSQSNLTQDSIVTLFGSKLFKSLIRFEQSLPTEESCESYRLSYTDCLKFSKDCIFTGYISSCGSGRRSSDMQYISVNKRPCHIPKFCKLINEVFRLFSKNQYPFVQLDISTKRDQVDINVTPDKRQVFLTHEKALLAILKSSLLKLYNGMNHKIETITMRQSTLMQFKCNEMSKLPTAYTHPKSSRRSVSQTLHIANRSPMTLNPSSMGCHESSDTHLNSSDVDGSKSDFTAVKNINVSAVRGSIASISEKKSANQDKADVHDQLKQSRPRGELLQNLDVSVSSGTDDAKSMLFQLKSAVVSNSTDNVPGSMNDCDTLEANIVEQSDDPSCQKSPIHPEPEEKNQNLQFGCPKKFDRAENVFKDQHPLSFSFQELKERWGLKQRIIDCDSNKYDVLRSANFNAKIVSSENDKAEKELTKHFDRTNFKTMEIIGQFNLGFIIAKHSKDLFIIDQHASDEKYNFETLQKITKLNGQPLIVPQKLELTASDVMVLEENMAIFVQNGFTFEIKESDIGIKSVFLLKVPSSKNLVFDASDVAELIFILRDHPHTLCRPSRIRQMFASRACRKSVMIGSPLTSDSMKQIISHMSEMEQPWNCPHGRPTMRHLIDLSMIAKPDMIS